MRQKFFLFSICFSFSLSLSAQQKEVLVYHPIQTDKKGNIISWYDENPGKAYALSTT